MRLLALLRPICPKSEPKHLVRLRPDRIARPRRCHSRAEDGLPPIWPGPHLEQLIRDAEVNDRVERVRGLVCVERPAYPAVSSD